MKITKKVKGFFKVLLIAFIVGTILGFVTEYFNIFQYGKRNKREKIKLHTPIKDISLLTDEIKEFNFNLYLCCLMTYGCLLRPHREISELEESDMPVI